MAIKTYEVILEIDDRSGSEAEDLEEILTELFDGYYPGGLPSDLKARVVEVNEAPYED